MFNYNSKSNLKPTINFDPDPNDISQKPPDISGNECDLQTRLLYIAQRSPD